MTKFTSSSFLMLSLLLVAFMASWTTAMGWNWYSAGLLKKNDVKHRVDEEVKMVSNMRNKEDRITREMDATQKRRNTKDAASEDKAAEESTTTSNKKAPFAFSRRGS